MSNINEAIAEITSANHDNAEHGERGIRILRDFQHLEYGTKLYAHPAQCLHQIQEPSEAEQAAWHAGLDEGRAQAAQPEDARELVTLALGLSLPPKGGPSFAWAYLLSSIRELVKCEEELTLLKAGMEMSKAAPAAVAVTDEREAFERAYASHAIEYAGIDDPQHDVQQRLKDGRDGDQYKHLHDSGAWVGWKLARALLATATGLPVQAVEPVANFGLSAESIEKLRTSGLKPEEIAGDDPAAQLDRVRELVWWFVRLSEGHANPKWLPGHAFELAYYIACMDVKNSIDLEPIKRASYKEGAMVSPSERAMLERIGFLKPLPQAQADARDAGDLYYVQDARHSAMVGNCPSWWRPGGNGYTTNLDDAARFTLQEAMSMHKNRDTDLPWPCAEIDQLRRATVDCQYMPRSWEAQRESIAAIAAAKGE